MNGLAPNMMVAPLPGVLACAKQHVAISNTATPIKSIYLAKKIERYL